jgi:hypothetical protein
MRSERPLGRASSTTNVRLLRRVAFIGFEVQRKLFGTIPPVGEAIRVGGQPFEIVGVMQESADVELQRPDKCHLHSVDDRHRADGHQSRHRRVALGVGPACRAEKQVREYMGGRYR